MKHPLFQISKYWTYDYWFEVGQVEDLEGLVGLGLSGPRSVNQGPKQSGQPNYIFVYNYFGWNMKKAGRRYDNLDISPIP